MMKKNISKILKQFLSNRFSPSTEERVQKWIIKDENTEDKEQASLEYWDELSIEANSNTYSALDRVNKRIGFHQKQVAKIPLHRRLSRIAAVLIPLFLIAGGYLYYTSNNDKLIQITVAYGDEKHMFLPDSSEIWINAGTTIKYPKEFEENQRTVYLEGEAYFSVKRNESKPFVVETKSLSVKVLGTKFNVKAYPDDNKVIATLASGKVEVNTNTKDSRILKPNEQLTFDNKTAKIDIIEIPSNETTGWITGQLIFTNSSFDEIVQTLERRFNVSIDADKSITSTSKLYTVKFLKNDSLDDIISVLEDVVGGFSYQKQGKMVILNKK